MKLIGVYNAPATVTMMGLVCGVLSCWLILHEQPEFAVVAFIWAGIFDLFDGMVARRKVREQMEMDFGIQIDSLADIVCFGMTPVFILYGLADLGFVTIVVSILYVIAVIQRLAYFNVLQTEARGGIQFYTGLPVTFAALIFAIAFSAYKLLPIAYFSIIAHVAVLLVAAAYVLPIRIRKPKGIVYIVMPILAVVFTALWSYWGIQG